MTTDPTPGTSGRRDFLDKAMAATIALTGGTLLAITASRAISPPLTFGDIPTLGLLHLPGLNVAQDIKVLNYALALEDLESDFYEQAYMRLTSGGVNKHGTTIPGLGLGLHEKDVFYTSQFGAVEAHHRDFLRGALQVDGITPNIDIKPKKYEFGLETKSREEVLAQLITVEATGTAAYLGAIPYFSTKLFLTAAAGIQGTEARHTTALTIVQNMLFNGDSPKPVAPLASDNHGIDTPMEPDAVLAAVSPYIVS